MSKDTKLAIAILIMLGGLGAFGAWTEQEYYRGVAIDNAAAQYNSKTGKFEWIDHSHDEERKKKAEAEANSILLDAAGRTTKENMPDEAVSPLPDTTTKIYRQAVKQSLKSTNTGVK